MDDKSLYQEIPTLQKLQAIAGTDVLVYHYLLDAFCKIEKLHDIEHHGFSYIHISWDNHHSFYSTHWCSLSTFRLKP